MAVGGGDWRSGKELRAGGGVLERGTGDEFSGIAIDATLGSEAFHKQTQGVRGFHHQKTTDLITARRFAG